MPEISVFPASSRQFARYLGDPEKPEAGAARIARLVGAANSTSMGAGIVVYERLTVDWNLGFDEAIVILEGSMRIISGGNTHVCRAGDVAWFPANTPLTYVVDDKVIVFYAIHPLPPSP